MSGKIITFEGIDGSGKTTLRNSLHRHFASSGKEVWSTSEPWSISESEIDPDPFVATMQLMADRRHHCNVLKSTKYDIALIDRFDLSTEAYQGYGGSVRLGLISELNDLATEGVHVNLRIWLDVPTDVAIQRVESREQLVDAAKVEALLQSFARLECVRYGYTRMRNRGYCQRIDATQSSDDVLREAIALIEQVL